MLDFKGRLIVGASLMAIALPGGAYAQSADSGVSSGDIIVTARRKEETLQDVPMTVQAVSSAGLQKLEIRQFEDVTRAVPGLQLTSNTNGIGTTASLRGINFDANAAGAYTSVEFYRNDAVITSGALFQSLYDIGQIEVLRGPQGTLRGRASPSGSITVTTRRPDLAEFGGYASGTVAEEDRWNVNGAVNVPIIKDKLAVRVAGFIGDSRGNGINGLNTVTGVKDNDIYDRNRAYRASVRADPFNGILVLDFNYERIHHKNRQYDQVMSFGLVDPARAVATTAPVITPDDRLGVTPDPRTSDQLFKIYNWQAQLNLLGQVLTYVGNRVEGKIEAVAPQDFAGLLSTGTSPVAPFNAYSQYTENINEQTTHEIRLQNQERIAGLFDYVVGAMQVKAHSPSLFNSSITAVTSGTSYPNYTLNNVLYPLGVYRFRDDREQSLFGNVTAHIGERLEVSGGIRRIWYNSLAGVRTGAYPPTGDPATTYANSASSFRCFGHSDDDLAEIGPGLTCGPTKKATIYSASANYKFTDNIMVYGTYGTSFRPGNSVVGWRGTQVGSFLSQFLDLPDEKSRSFEIGFKTSWFDRRLHFNVSAYTQKFTNYAFRLASPVIALSDTTATATLAPSFNFVAPVDAKVNGFEAELGWDVSANFNIAATLSFADGKIKNGVFPCVDLNDDNVPDTAPPTAAQLYAETNGSQVDTCLGNASSSASSRWAGTIQAEYSHDLNDKMQGYARGFLNWKGNNEGFSLNPYDQVSAYGLLDVFLGVRDVNGGWDASIFVKNLLDTNRVLTATDSPLTTRISAGTRADTQYLGITTLDPRTFGLTLRVAVGSH